MTDFISKEKIFANTTKLAEILLDSESYSDFHDKVSKSDILYDENKTYEVVPSGFIDFNQHLYEDINHMNSISSGLFIEKSLITFRIFIWTSRGEGFEIFKHVLRGNEIKNLKSLEDVKDYIFKHISELEDGIISTYGKNIVGSFEDFGKGIEAKRLPLANILKYLTIDNNISDLK